VGKRRNKKPKQKGRKRKSTYSTFNISAIGKHRRQGSKLSPPLARLPNLAPTRWLDDHMPEMLWAVLLTEVLDRREYLNVLRKVAVHCRKWFLRNEGEEPKKDGTSSGAVAPHPDVVVDHTKLSEVSDEWFEDFISIPLSHPLGYAALRPLLHLQSIPGIDRWKKHLNCEASSDDWNTMAKAIIGVLDHQSEKSTDIRWFKLILVIISGRMFFPRSMEEQLEELRVYPDKGDMRRVRPFIRSCEINLRRNPPSEWARKLWEELLGKTSCIDPTRDDEYKFIETRIEPKVLYAARDHVVERFSENMTAGPANPRLESAFGLVLYALAIVEEVGMHRVHTRIIGRLALRALVEANITLRYLKKHDSAAIWMSYRVYGAGQAKLAFLKAQELEGKLPAFMDEDALYAIANEDTWQEFLDIDVGHWANSNLRQLSIECGAKDLYDKYYDWASTFSHSHWGAVRDTNFVTCHNPLHRLHRLPRLVHRSLNSVEADVVALMNEMLEVLDELYPGKTALGKLQLVDVANAS
jgi:hypothetical protein